MTILDFYVEEEIVMRVEIPRTDYINKVCKNISSEDLCKPYITYRVLREFDIGNERGHRMEFTDKRVIEKMWYACFQHGFTNQYYDTWADKVVKTN